MNKLSFEAKTIINSYPKRRLSMKKVIAGIGAALAATSLIGCDKTAASSDANKQLRTIEQQQILTEQDSTDSIPEHNDKQIKILIYNGKPVRIPFIRTGSYSVEYIHTPYGIDKDETLDYNLTLNIDNTFSLTVVSDGVTAEHSGRWYEMRNQIMMFYDEQIDPSPHNVYVADSMFGELLPHGKIMIYDNGYTIVLSHESSNIQTL